MYFERFGSFEMGSKLFCETSYIDQRPSGEDDNVLCKRVGVKCYSHGVSCSCGVQELSYDIDPLEPNIDIDRSRFWFFFPVLSSMFVCFLFRPLQKLEEELNRRQSDIRALADATSKLQEQQVLEYRALVDSLTARWQELQQQFLDFHGRPEEGQEDGLVTEMGGPDFVSRVNKLREAIASVSRQLHSPPLNLKHYEQLSGQEDSVKVRIHLLNPYRTTSKETATLKAVIYKREAKVFFLSWPSNESSLVVNYKVKFSSPSCPVPKRNESKRHRGVNFVRTV